MISEFALRRHKTGIDHRPGGLTARLRSLLIFIVAAVLAASGCGDSAESPSGGGDAALAGLQADALERLVTVDNSFAEGVFPFSRVHIVTVIGDEPDRPLDQLALDRISDALEPLAPVVFVPNTEDAIDDLSVESAGGEAVAGIENLRIEGERAEIDMRLWCGSLCGIFLTYEAELTDDTWQILGITGPIVMS